MKISKERFQKDRRTKCRFPMQRELRFKMFQNDRLVFTGVGHTVDISSSGVAFEARGVKTGYQVELSIGWPVLLDETCRVRLIVLGRVVRAGQGIAACTLDRYEFRTQSRVTQADPAKRVDTTVGHLLETTEKDWHAATRA
jgi:hypothetical protein